MTFKNENIKFDGKKSGIVVQIKNANGSRPKYIVLDRKIKIFNNLDVAKISAKELNEDGVFSYWISNDGVLININQCRYDKDTHTFQYIDNGSKTIYNFKELRTRKVSNLGYLIFDNGDKERISNNTPWKRQNELLSYITDVVSRLFGEKLKDTGISNIDIRKKEIVLSIRSTTTKIHIVTNSLLMDINQERTIQREKDPRIKRIPFIKTMDKYLTFYIFSTRDLCESKRVEGDEKASYIIKNIISDLAELYPEADPRYEKVNYDGFISMEE